MKKIALYIILILGSGTLLFSQGGSNYSIIGFGDINYDINASYMGLAGTAIAFPSETAINLKNPALWSIVKTTRLQAGYRFNQHISDAASNTNWQNNANLSGFSAIFAIDTNRGISASLGLIPYTSINYLTATKINETINDIPLEGTSTYQGKGGITQAYIGASTNIIDGLAVGATLFTNFGNVIHSRTTAFTNDPYLFTYTNSRQDYFSGLGYKAGLYITPIDNLSFGYFIESYNPLTVESTLNFSSPLIGDTSYSRNANYDLPLSQGLGISFTSGVFIVGADFSYQDYTNFKYNPGNNSNFTNSWQFSIGVNRFGNYSINAKTLDKVSYKFGFATRKLYYNIYNNDIMEYAVSVGALIPFSDTFNSDIGLSLGTRATSNNNLIKEYFARLSIDLSIGEVWFIPFKREY